ncbi:MAG: hypothetical protein WDN03_18075 [Rhizomicrobium sp.]
MIQHIGNLELEDLVVGHHLHMLDVERLVEIDVFLVQRVPEMIVRRADDLVEGGRALLVAVELDHRLEIVRRHGVVHDVLGDVPVGHAVLLPCLALR